MFVVKRSHHNPILTPDKDHYWEAFATFNMSVIKKGRTFYGVYRAIGAPDRLRTPSQVSIIGICSITAPIEPNPALYNASGVDFPFFL